MNVGCYKWRAILSTKAAGALNGKRHLILDRDTKYTERFRAFLDENGTEVIRLPPLSSNLNAYASYCTSSERIGVSAGKRRRSEGDNLRRLEGFRDQVFRAWFQSLRRRSQRHRMTWVRFKRLIDRYVPRCRQQHPYPPQGNRATT
jgi:hypothetical protein